MPRIRMNEFLAERRESVPAWLEKYNAGDAFDRQRFFFSRVVYYPGAGLDFHPVETFGLSGAAHLFVMVDACLSAKDYRDALADPPREASNAAFLRDYRPAAFKDLCETDLAPRAVRYHVEERRSPARSVDGQPYACLAVLERRKDAGEGQGPQCMAILFLGADGHAAYDALFCQEGARRAPYAVLIQDHGWGGDYSSFARGGVMEAVAIRTQVMPTYLLADRGSRPWSGYKPCAGVEASVGGQYGNERILLERTGKRMGR